MSDRLFDRLCLWATETIAYYLSHVEDVEAYLASRQVRSKEVRELNEVKFEAQGLRDRLLAHF